MEPTAESLHIWCSRLSAAAHLNRSAALLLVMNVLEPFQRNLLTLAVYAIIVAFVFYKMWEDVSDYITPSFDRAALEGQVAELGLQGQIAVQFKLAERYKPRDFCTLAITVFNHSEESALYVNWERSTLSNLEGESQRLIRIVPGGIDLAQPQVPSAIAPARKLSEQVTAEGALRLDAAGKLGPGGPLLSGKEIEQAIATQKPFTLRLIVEVPGIANLPARRYALLCPFRLSRTPLRRALYWD